MTNPTKGTRKPFVHYDVDAYRAKYAANADAMRKYARELYHNNKEYREAKLAKAAQRRAAHPGGWRKYKQTRQRWYQNNKRRFFYRKVLRHFKKLSRDDIKKMTIALARIYYKQRGRCALSGLKLDETAHLDHIVPRSKGGTNVSDNLQFLDPRVNAMKSNMMTDEFLAMCRTIINHNDNVRHL